eukprot:TRINITY_DN14426_c0_g1_i1.p1 TRINITY_DN14426_c0_g1~~TRINITY_DN14426_c0_g1_i1.p1  ORF type:complete len:664 (+),score=82.33 TRINITY_DN14426_c0_g1_i1:48-1994(+)
MSSAFVPPHLRRQCDDEAAEHLGLKERISRDLEQGHYDCVVCVESVRSSESVWSCDVCYGIVHLGCVKMWAKQSNEGGSWRCPKCQGLYTETPDSLAYRCFCKKVLKPQNDDSYGTPHTCGQRCNKIRTHTTCRHPCNTLCHPGPCPPCTHTSPPKHCYCGKITYHTGCSEIDKGRSCNEPCDKLKSCGVHRCTRTCHPGPCDPCEEAYEQACFCGKEPSKVLPCKASPAPPDDGCVPTTYSCSEVCGKTLKCGVHKCTLPCHFGDCHDCERDPRLVTNCPCGKVELSKLSPATRTKCTDPIATCGRVCERYMECGVSTHRCTRVCHDDPCGLCTQPSVVRCRCGGKQVRMRCDDRRKPAGSSVNTIVEETKKESLDIFSGSGKKGKGKAKSVASEKITLPFTCMVRCTAKKTCGKHTCNTICCSDKGHIHSCTLTCGRNLPCGQHRCEAACHTGTCPPCLYGGFTELSCRCGATFIEPPIPCGTEPPSCPLPCRIPRACGHPPNHKCHFDDCPPCTVMVKKRCASHNKLCDWLTPCHVPTATCRVLCFKMLSCGKHPCKRQCHAGECAPACPQNCMVTGPCGHPCNTPCHPGPCQPCSQDVLVTCNCGRTHISLKCHERQSYPAHLECGEGCRPEYTTTPGRQDSDE